LTISGKVVTRYNFALLTN